MDGLTQAHLALAYFVLPQVRNSVVARSSFTIITCNEDGTIKRAVEYFLSMWGYVLPSTDGTLAFWHQHDPLLIELATHGRYDAAPQLNFRPLLTLLPGSQKTSHLCSSRRLEASLKQEGSIKRRAASYPMPTYCW